MARTLHIELTPSRRSKRLLANGYYHMPAGESSPFLDVSSEDDDNASMHSNSSSVYSDRAVHYNESPTSSRRRRKHKKANRGTPTPLISTLVEQSRRVQNIRSSEKKYGSRDRLTSSTSATLPRQSTATNYSVQTYSQSTTQLHSYKDTVVTKSESQGNLTISGSSRRHSTLSAGDRPTSSAATRSSTVGLDNGFRNDMIGTSADRMIEGTSEVRQRKPPPPRQRRNLSVTLISTLLAIQQLVVSFISTLVHNVCKTIFLTAVTIYSWEVWLLAKRVAIAPWRVVKFLLLPFIFMVLAHVIARSIIGDDYGAVMYKALSEIDIDVSQQGEKTFTQFEANSQALWSSKNFEEALAKAEVTFAMKLAEVKDSLVILRKEFGESVRGQQRSDEIQEFTNTRIKNLEDEVAALHDQLKKLNYVKIDSRITVLEGELVKLQAQQQKSSETFKQDVGNLKITIQDTARTMATKQDVEDSVAALMARLTEIDSKIRASRTVPEGANETRVKEIASIQFVESFLAILEKTKAPADDKSGIHSAFLSWLNDQGYAKKEDIKSDIKMLRTNFAAKLERIRQGMRRHSSTITLERIVERPLLETSLTVNSELEKEVKKWIHDALAVYSADRIALADHALETSGGFVVSTRCSESYDKKTSLISLLGIPFYYNINTPRSVIQAGNLPGECWSFKGSEGYIVIALSGSVQPTSFSLEHIPRELSPLGSIDSAPKDFIVLGLADAYDYGGTLLGEYKYDQEGPVIQQFEKQTANKEYFSHIELRVRSNWGNPVYTCLYRFRVHGNRAGSVLPAM